VPGLGPEEFPDVPTLAAAWRADERPMRGWPATPDRPSLAADAFTGRPPWLHLVSVVNHGTQHRGEAAMILTDRGHPRATST
jgi:hypothetical protein